MTTAPPPGTIACPQCGAAIGPEQDWCIECGTAARTRIAPTPNWRVPALLVATLIALSGAGLAAAFVALTNDEPVATSATTAPTTPAVAPSPTPTTTAIPTPVAPPTAVSTPTVATTTATTQTTPATTTETVPTVATVTVTTTTPAPAARTTRQDQ